MKILLLDRVKNPEELIGYDVEFFGPWAENINSPSDLSKPRVTYKDSNDVSRTLKESINLSEEILSKLTEILPSLVQTENVDRSFWRLLLGNYVVRMSGIIKDIEKRYISLPEKDYIIVKSREEFSYDIPASFSEFQSLVSDSMFRIYMSELFLTEKFNDTLYLDYLAAKDGEPYPSRYSIRSRDIMLFRKIRKYFNKHNPLINRTNAKAIVWDNINFFADINPKYYLAGDFIFESNHIDKTPKVDPIIRQTIENELGGFIGKIFALTFPIGLLEGLRNNIESIDLKKLDSYPNLQRIYTHGRIMVDNDKKRVLASLLHSRGFEVFSIQHGGTMNYLSHPSFYTEGEIPTNLISWGSSVGDNLHNEAITRKTPKIIPSLYLKSVKDNVRDSKKKWRVIIITLNEDRQLKWIYSPIFPDMAYDYFKRQKILFESFSEVENVLVKLYPYEYGWYQLDWLINDYPKLNVDTKRKNLINLIDKAELVIMDYHATAFLETLVINKPLLCTWNREWFKGSYMFEKDIDQLKNIGIFHENPRSLIEEYQNISSNIQEWWREEKRIKVMAEVKNNLLSNIDNAVDAWENELTSNSSN